MALFPDRKPTPSEMNIVNKYPLTGIFLRSADVMYIAGWSRDMDEQVKKIEKQLGGVFRDNRLHIAGFTSFSMLLSQGLLSESLSAPVLTGMTKRLICMGAEIEDREELNTVEGLIAGRAISIYFNTEKMKNPVLENIAAGAISGMLQIGIGLKDLSRHEADFVVRLGGLKPGDKAVFNN